MIPILSALFSGTGACASTGGAWHELASAAQLLGPGQLESAEKAVSALPKEQRALAEGSLNAIAALPATPEGVRAAGQKIQETQIALAGSGPRRPGTDPNVATYLEAADCLLHGLVFKAGQATAAGPDRENAAVALLRAVQNDLKVFPAGSSGQVATPGWVENELRLGLTPPLYLSALRVVEP